MDPELHNKRRNEDKYGDIKLKIKKCYNDDFPVVNFQYNCDIKHDLKECAVYIKEDIKDVVKHDLDNDLTDKNDLFLPLRDNADEAFKCPKCLKSFTKTGLPRHTCALFHCKDCAVTCNNRSKFESHLRKHAHLKKRERKSLTESTKCWICHNLITKRQMKRHLKLHKVSVPCCKCGKIFKKDQMKEHMKTHFDYRCRVCNKISKCKESFEIHKRVHEKAKRNPCSECNATFQHLVELARHITVSHRNIEKGKYECPFCKKVVSAINHHLRTHQKDPKPCEKCSAVLPNYSAYKSHLRYHGILSKTGNDRVITPKNLVSRNTESLTCHICFKVFPCRNHLLQHGMVHVKSKFYTCPYCEDHTLTSLVDLIAHVSNNHHGISKTHSKCIFCFRTVANIESHMESHCIGKYECPFCEIIFSTIPEYRKHYNRRHKLKNEEKISLNVFMAKYAVTKANFRKISCFQCDSKVRISHMKRHIGSHQTLRCNMCMKIFFNKRHWMSHLNEHQVKSQRCPACSLSFISHIRLMSHLKMCHKIAFSASKSCSRCSIQMPYMI